MVKYQDLADSIIKGDNIKSKEIARKLVDEGVPAVEILNDGLMPGMDVVGKKFKANEFYIPEVLIAARAMHAAMDIIKPLLSETGADTKGKMYSAGRPPRHRKKPGRYDAGRRGIYCN